MKTYDDDLNKILLIEAKKYLELLNPKEKQELINVFYKKNIFVEDVFSLYNNNRDFYFSLLSKIDKFLAETVDESMKNNELFNFLRHQQFIIFTKYLINLLGKVLVMRKLKNYFYLLIVVY